MREFYACYLLQSKKENGKGKTYIGCDLLCTQLHTDLLDCRPVLLHFMTLVLLGLIQC